MPKKNETYFDGYIAALEDLSKLINHRADAAEKEARKAAKGGQYQEALRVYTTCEVYDRLYGTLADISGSIDPQDTRKQVIKKLEEFYDTY